MNALSKRKLSWMLYALLSLLLLAGCGSGGQSTTTSSTGGSSSNPIQIVAAENFYGDIAKQIGGSYVNVTSILSDPNIDPHEYESNVKNAAAVSDARLVIENSGGYDSWMDKLLSASPNSDRRIIKAYDIAPHKLPDNEHVWYSPTNASAIAQTITSTLKELDSAHSATFDKNLTTFQQSIDTLQQKIATIKAKYAKTPVGLTETIFLYQTELLQLNVLTPFEFQKAIAEGNDPPASTVAQFNNQISTKAIKVLIYNKQTNTSITTNLQNAAQKQNIPIVPVTETMPPEKTYQTWMTDQLTALQQALGG